MTRLFVRDERRVRPEVLTPQRRKVLAFLVAHHPDHPTADAIAEHMRWHNASSVSEVMHALWHAGYLARHDTSSRYTAWSVTTEAIVAIYTTKQVY